MKNWKLHPIFILCTLFIVLNCTVSFSQEKQSPDNSKSKSVTVIGGVKYYLHTVEKGQTFYAIAKIYASTVNDIVIENPEAIDGIKPGQVLRIPFEKPKPKLIIKDTTQSVTHKVEKGQTLFSLSKQYGTTVEKLTELNPELKDGLKVGQTLKIPSTKQNVPTVSQAKPASVNEVKPVAVKETKPTPVSEVKPAIVKEGTPTPVNEVKPAAVKDIKPTLVSEVKPIQVISEQKPTDVKKDSLKIEVPEKSLLSTFDYKGRLKAEYNIAFFLPFQAAEANAIDIEKIIKRETEFSNRTSVAIQFYEGALLAIDSLKKQHLKAKVYVYDIDDKDSLNIVNILKKPELASMDLMIGPFYGSSFMPISKFAKEHSIAIVSPFIQVNKILFNPYVCKVLPSSTLQIEQMAHFVVDSFHTQNIILINNENAKEVSFFYSFKNTANKAMLKAGHPVSDSVKDAKNIAAVQSLLSMTKTNVIVLPSNNQSYVTEFIRLLNNTTDKYKVVLFGQHSWMNFDNLDIDYLNSLSLHIPSNSFIDYSNPNTLKFIKDYREKYKTEPEDYVFQGFDVTYYFISSLQKYGSGFLKNLEGNKYQGIDANYNFIQYPSECGFENKSVFILKYENYKLVKAN